MASKEMESASRIGFVSTRIAGTDGVSLEIDKWATVLEDMGIECYYITGESDRPEERTVIIEEAHFNLPAILDISRTAFEMEHSVFKGTFQNLLLYTLVQTPVLLHIAHRPIASSIEPVHLCCRSIATLLFHQKIAHVVIDHVGSLNAGVLR